MNVNVAMRAHDQCSIFSTGGKFRPDYGLLLELHALTLVTRSYALLPISIGFSLSCLICLFSADVNTELLSCCVGLKSIKQNELLVSNLLTITRGVVRISILIFIKMA